MPTRDPSDLDGLSNADLRLMTRVARLYHEDGVRQPEIAARLDISQPRVSRLLKRAVAVGIVRTTVVAPPGINADLEQEVETAYGLRAAVVADTGEVDSEAGLLRALGTAAAAYLEATLVGGDRIGVSSWSSTLLAAVDAMRPRPARDGEQVVQVIGGVGTVAAQARATRLTARLAQVTGAEPIFLPAPGLVATPAAREALTGDPGIAESLRATGDLTVLLAGIGALDASELLRESGNAIAAAELDTLRRLGAVGDICLRYFDETGAAITALDDRIVGIDSDDLRAIPRRVGVAGGGRKWTAIRAAVRGGWVNVLVTDRDTAQMLVREAG